MVKAQPHCPARQARDDIALQCGLAGVVDRGEAGGGFGDNLGSEIVVRTAPRQNMNVEGREIHHVKAHAFAAIRQPPRQIGAGPVKDGHEVVAQHLDPAGREIAQAFLPCRDIDADITALAFDVFGNGQALDHFPFQP